MYEGQRCLKSSDIVATIFKFSCVISQQLSFSNLNRKTVQKNRFMYRLYRSKKRMLGQSTSVYTVKIDKQIGRAYSI